MPAGLSTVDCSVDAKPVCVDCVHMGATSNTEYVKPYFRDLTRTPIFVFTTTTKEEEEKTDTVQILFSADFGFWIQQNRKLDRAPQKEPSGVGTVDQ